MWLWSIHVIGNNAAAGVGAGVGIIVAVRPNWKVIEHRHSAVTALLSEIVEVGCLCMSVAAAATTVCMKVADAVDDFGASAFLTAPAVSFQVSTALQKMRGRLPA